MRNHHIEHFSKVQELLDGHQAFVVVTMVGVRGYAPQDPGAKAIVTASGLSHGTVGGGKIEARAILHAQTFLKTESGELSEMITWNLQRDIGMSCGGEVTLFFEVFPAVHAWTIAVFGAGHVAQATVRLLLTLDCQVICLDTRREWLDRLPEHRALTKVLSEDLPKEVATLPHDCFSVVMTQGHQTDLPVLIEIMKTRDAPYVGVLGSSVKSKVLRKDLREAGVSEEKVFALRCPMGLKFGKNDPSEIAVSIAAELLQTRDTNQQRTRSITEPIASICSDSKDFLSMVRTADQNRPQSSPQRSKSD